MDQAQVSAAMQRTQALYASLSRWLDQQPEDAGALSRFAEYVTEHDHGTFTGPLLARYKELHQIDDRALAEFLNCHQGQLVRLVICGRPRAQWFESDVARIAIHVHVHDERLCALYQETMRPAPSTDDAVSS